MRRFCFFFFNDTATTEIYTLSLHDALPISPNLVIVGATGGAERLIAGALASGEGAILGLRSGEHTSEIQSRQYLVSRLLLEIPMTSYTLYRTGIMADNVTHANMSSDLD